MSSKSVKRRILPGRLTAAVIESVAEAKGVQPQQIETPLYDAVDTDALESIFQTRPDGRTRDGGMVMFILEGCEVVVKSEGEVIVTPHPSAETVPTSE